MRNSLKILVFLGAILLMLSACSVQWTQAIQNGHIANTDFAETVPVHIQKGLLFLPVTINGQQYRFLYDSGAPFSISEKLQASHSFKIVSKGNIIDSDHNRKKVDWVRIDTINIGEVSFIDQTAFVADFTANPILECLNIDGIIGSNLMRHCNWTIDQEQKQLSLHSNVHEKEPDQSLIIPFKTDYQYNIFFDIDIGKATIKNVLMDYGSNGSVALNKEIFSMLRQHKIINAVFTERGVHQTGVLGKPVYFTGEITWTDSICVGNKYLQNIMLKTGKTDMVGNALLSKYKVTIDWENKNLFFSETKLMQGSNRYPGFRIGSSEESGIYIQSVMEESTAYEKGVRPGMQVVKVDGLDFENGHDFCDYVAHEYEDEIFLQLIDSTGQKTNIVLAADISKMMKK